MSDTNKKGLSALFKKKWFAMLFAVLCSFALWLFVVVNLSPEIELQIHDVPVEIGTATSTQLQPVEGTEATVTLRISGKRFQIAGLKAKDFTVVADASKVTSANSYLLPLSVVTADTDPYTVVSITPENINVRFDRILTREFTIEADVSGLYVPDGYVNAPADDFSVTPATVTVQGPEDVMSRIVSARVAHTFEENLTETFKGEERIEYYDAAGALVESDLIQVSTETAVLGVRVRRITEVPLSVSFINTPTDFPIEQLTYKLSNTAITVAAEDSILRNYQELTVGYINFKQLDLTANSTMTFDINLPDDFLNINHIESVVVEFDVADMASTTLNLKNFLLTNLPEGYIADVTTTSIDNVTFVGSAADIARLAANDVIVEIDMSEREAESGQYQVSTEISAPTSGFVWALGDHKVVVNVTEE